MVCQRLEGGRLTAIDRSAKMIAAAARRNAAYVEVGKAEFLVASLEDADLGDRRFDVVFAVRVRLFHREPATSAGDRASRSHGDRRRRRRGAVVLLGGQADPPDRATVRSLRASGVFDASR